MPNVRNMDGSPVDGALRWIAPPSLPMREPTQVLDRGKDRPWPFLYSYQKDGSVTENRGRKTTRYAEAESIGEALI